MDALTSTEFRKRYASLTEPTTVTVNGHAIGIWTPSGGPMRPLHLSAAGEVEIVAGTVIDPTASFAEFRPVPKPGKRP
jgi:hypothetical protein